MTAASLNPPSRPLLTLPDGRAFQPRAFRSDHVADVLLLFLAALIVLGGAVAIFAVVRSGRRRHELAKRDRPRLLRQELAEIDDYIREVDRAAADADLDRLEQRKGTDRWDGLSSR